MKLMDIFREILFKLVYHNESPKVISFIRIHLLIRMILLNLKVNWFGSNDSKISSSKIWGNDYQGAGTC
jgi:hypothetical protein